MTNPEVGDCIKVTVDRISGSGNVIAYPVDRDCCNHHVHVQDGTPGTLVDVKITDVRKGYSVARVSPEIDDSGSSEVGEAEFGDNTTASEGLQELASGVDPICESQEPDSNKMDSNSTEQHEKRSKELRESISGHI